MCMCRTIPLSHLTLERPGNSVAFRRQDSICLNHTPTTSFNLRTLSGVPLISFPSKKKFLSILVCTRSSFWTIAFCVRIILSTSRDRAWFFLQSLEIDSALHAAFLIASPRTNPALAAAAEILQWLCVIGHPVVGPFLHWADWRNWLRPTSSYPLPMLPSAHIRRS